MTTYKELTNCLACGHDKLQLVLDLNDQPLANSFKLNAEDVEDNYPLKLNVCTDCTHLQLSHAVNPDLLFKNYLYVSGTTQTLRDYFDWFAQDTLNYFTSKPKTILDIACNDGSQLDSYKKLGLETYGIDPATNLHSISTDKGHNVICDYLKEEHVEQLPKMDIITAQNVFAHNSYPLEFLKICKNMLSKDGLLFVQTSQADMVKQNYFDTIYHEHLSFFNASSMNALAHRAGLTLHAINKTEIHGGSYVFVFGKSGATGQQAKDVLEEERKAGLQNLVTYSKYADNCNNIVAELNKTISDYVENGYKIVGYGAAAKGNTLLNYAGFKLDFVIDDNPLKQNLYTPGSSILVTPIEELIKYKDAKILFVPLAWNFYDEIVSRIKQVRDTGNDKFVRYFPSVTVDD